MIVPFRSLARSRRRHSAMAANLWAASSPLECRSHWHYSSRYATHVFVFRLTECRRRYSVRHPLDRSHQRNGRKKAKFSALQASCKVRKFLWAFHRADIPGASLQVTMGVRKLTAAAFNDATNLLWLTNCSSAGSHGVWRIFRRTRYAFQARRQPMSGAIE